MFSTVISRRLLKSSVKSNSALMACATRAFSSNGLLVPLTPNLGLPQELQSYDETNKELTKLKEEFIAFNNNCGEELKEMNQNRITNIIDRGGVEGWETAEDLAYLKKTFEFNSFEQAQYFVQRVGKFASQHDHHPEWEVSQGGKVVSATLTSHFAGNKVTLYDFQLAEQMNKDFKVTVKNFKQYPLISNYAWGSWIVYFLGYFTVIVAFNLITPHIFTQKYPSINQKEGKVKLHTHYLIQGVKLPDSKDIKSEKDIEEFVEKNSDQYAFQQNVFRVANKF